MSEWIVVTTFASGDRAYYGEGRTGRVGRTPYRGNAYRFDSELSAREAGYRARGSGYIGEFTVEQMPDTPRFKPLASNGDSG